MDAIAIGGSVGLEIIRRDAWIPPSLLPIVREGYYPKTDLGRVVAKCMWHLPIDLACELLARITSCVVIESELSVVILRAMTGKRTDFGVVSRRVITTVGVTDIATIFNTLAAPSNFNFHALGTGTAAEAIGNTALQTEMPNGTYAVGSTRPTGAKSNPSANVYQSVASNVVAAGVTVQEMGLFDQAATGGGNLWDRFLTGTQTLLTGDTFQTTVKATFTAGG